MEVALALFAIASKPEDADEAETLSPTDPASTTTDSWAAVRIPKCDAENRALNIVLLVCSIEGFDY